MMCEALGVEPAACVYLAIIGVIMLLVRAVERRFRIPGN